MKRVIVLALTLFAAAPIATTSAFATPGAVDKNGCHSKPKHCHSASELSTMKNGRKYVAFGEDR
jgi:hypothetical protein